MKETKLEREAKAFKMKKKPSPTQHNPLTARRYLAGQAMAVLMSQSKSQANLHDIKREAYEIADFMLED